MTDDDKDFPIISETVLGDPRKRMWGLIPTVRDRHELPAQRPGTVLVFSDGSRWTPARGRVKGTEDYVVGATSVSLVWTRSREVDVEVAIPSLDPADDFTVFASFVCQVTIPELIAEQGPIDVVGRLRTFLQQDRELLARGVRHRVEEIHDVRRLAQARVRGYCDEFSPRIPGLEVTLAAVQVLTPIELRDHTRKIRDAHWARDLAELLGEHEDVDARRLAERFRDPEYIAALAVTRDKIDLGKLVVDAYADRSTKDANLLEFLKLLEKNGQLDRLPIDGQVLVGRLLERYGGAATPIEADRPTQAPVSVTPDGPRSIEGEAVAPAGGGPAEGDRFRVTDDA